MAKVVLITAHSFLLLIIHSPPRARVFALTPGLHLPPTRAGCKHEDGTWSSTGLSFQLQTRGWNLEFHRLVISAALAYQLGTNFSAALCTPSTKRAGLPVIEPIRYLLLLSGNALKSTVSPRSMRQSSLLSRNAPPPPQSPYPPHSPFLHMAIAHLRTLHARTLRGSQ